MKQDQRPRGCAICGRVPSGGENVCWHTREEITKHMEAGGAEITEHVVRIVEFTEHRCGGPAHRHRRRYRLTLKNVQGPGTVAISTRHRGEHE